MGLLIEGKWHDKWYETASHQGRFIRQESQFRNWITKDGSKGPNGSDGFIAEKGRYHLYVSYACPWAHRTLIVRTLKNLTDMISVSVVDPLMAGNGWTFSEENSDTLNNKNFLHEIYTDADPSFTGRVTVPVLWDKKTKTIVSNESSEIIRMLNNAFDDLGATKLDIWPVAQHAEIEELNERIYKTVNNGVYRAGFATTQEAYDEAVVPLFNSLDWLEEILATRRYLTGDSITEADIRLFTTLVRFDPVYVGHFKCNLRTLMSYPNLWAYTCDIYQTPGVKETVHMDHIKSHYYSSHIMINPTAIVPMGPVVDYDAPHGRNRTY